MILSLGGRLKKSGSGRFLDRIASAVSGSSKRGTTLTRVKEMSVGP